MGDLLSFSCSQEKNSNNLVILPIRVGIDVSTLDMPEGKKIALKLRALIDTGATNSCISEYYAKICKLMSTQYATMRSVNGIQKVPLYSLDVILTDEMIFEDVPVLQIISGSEFDFIIGMDILSKGRILIDNTEAESVFEFSVSKERLVL